MSLSWSAHTGPESLADRARCRLHSAAVRAFVHHAESHHVLLWAVRFLASNQEMQVGRPASMAAPSIRSRLRRATGGHKPKNCRHLHTRVMGPCGMFLSS